MSIVENEFLVIVRSRIHPGVNRGEFEGLKIMV